MAACYACPAAAGACVCAPMCVQTVRCGCKGGNMCVVRSSGVGRGRWCERCERARCDGRRRRGRGTRPVKRLGKCLGCRQQVPGARCHPAHAALIRTYASLGATARVETRPAAVWNDFKHTKCRSTLLQLHPCGGTRSLHSFASSSGLRAAFCTSDACEHDVIVNVCTPQCTECSRR